MSAYAFATPAPSPEGAFPQSSKAAADPASSGAAPLERTRWRELDALRGIAALCVVAYHFTVRYQESIGHSGPLLMQFPLGKYGVKLFFMISGFVIFMTVDKSRQPRDFMVSRFSRLYPTYWFCALLTFTVTRICGLPGREVDAVSALLNFSMIQDLFNVPYIDGVYWTLRIEMLFYLFVLAMLVSKSIGKVNIILNVWLVACIALFLADRKYGVGPIPPLAGKILLIETIPLFALGISYYQFWRQGISGRRAVQITWGLALFYLMLESDGTERILGLIFNGIFMLLIGGKLRFLLRGPWVFLGRISFPLYLVHQNIGYIIILRLENAGADPNVAVAIAALFSLALATFVNVVWERPAASFLRRKIGKPAIAA
jgi:peptidoglycan/LPS O-acetylase OafA/YrhL